MNRKQIWGLTIVSIITIFMLASIAYAVDRSNTVGGGSLTKQTLGLPEGQRFNRSAASSDDAQGGNVTHLNVTTSKSTVKWAGYLGSVTATLRLGIGSTQLFSFGTDGGVTTVLASTASNFDFSNLQTVSKAAVDTIFGFGKAVDNATSTFNRTQTVAGVTGATSTSLVAHTAAINSSGSCMLNGTNAGIGVCALDYTLYNTSILADNATTPPCDGCKNSIAFAVPVVLNQRDFRNSTEVDYELMVAVGSASVAETYFFFLDVE